MSEKEINRFDEEAEYWDEVPGRILMATTIADRIKAEVPLDAGMKAMEFGCGTGLITMQLIHRLKSITAADTAAKMVVVLEKKPLKRILIRFQPSSATWRRTVFLRGNLI